MRSFYDILGVAKEATEEQIRASYRRRALVMHPDINKGEHAEDDFRDLQEAFAALSDADKRREYDALQRRMIARQTKPDEIDVALSSFDITIEPTVKKKKKKKKKKPVAEHTAHRAAPASFDDIPAGYVPPSDIF